jgi:hypothetical protein
MRGVAIFAKACFGHMETNGHEGLIKQGRVYTKNFRRVVVLLANGTFKRSNLLNHKWPKVSAVNAGSSVIFVAVFT